MYRSRPSLSLRATEMASFKAFCQQRACAPTSISELPGRTRAAYPSTGAAGLDATLSVGISLGGVVSIPTIHLGLTAGDAGLLD